MAILFVAFLPVGIGIALCTHRLVHGQWRGVPLDAFRRRGRLVAGSVIALWAVFLFAVRRGVWGSALYATQELTFLIVISIVLGCAMENGERR